MAQKVKKELKDYIYYTGSTRQAFKYKTTTEYISNHIKGIFAEGNDIAEALKQLKYAATNDWYPELEFSGEDEEEKRKRADDALTMKYKALLDAAVRRIDTYESNKSKAYSVLLQIDEKPDTTEERLPRKIYNYPIE